MNTTLLVGTEEVSRAARQMREAADSMNNAAGTIANALEQHQRFMEDWLMRLESVLARGEE